MKKMFLITVALLAWGSMALAQDTIVLKGPKSNYYCTDWFDTTAGYTSAGILDGGPANDVLLVLRHTPDTLTVYGIAACVVARDFGCDDCDSAYIADYTMWNTYYQTLSHDSCYEYLQLYQMNGMSVEKRGEDMRVHVEDSPAFYMDMQLHYPSLQGGMMHILPVFERYFAEPQTVTDTFALALTSWRPAWHSFEVCLVRFDMQGQAKDSIAYLYGGDKMLVRNDEDRIGPFYIFPILTPEAGMGGGDSTLSVNDAELLERYVNLVPNPASSSVQVASSYGLTRIEAYDATGRKCYDRPATGLTATLDLTSWPKGTSILHIHTPAGIVTKKLLVR